MRKVQYTLTMIFACMSIQSIETKEVGRHDGGEYCLWTPGLQSDFITKDSTVGLYEDDQDQAEDAFVGEMDFEAIRNMFPIFKSQVHGHPLVYLDSASTAQMPQMVLDAIVAYYENYKSNVGRGLYAFAEQATRTFEKTRAKVARFIGAKKQEIVFTSGATAGINLVAHIWAKHHLKKGDEIIVSEIEHNANYVPWQQLAKEKELSLKIIPINESGVLDIEALKSSICDKTKLVAVTHQSNVLGTTNDIAAIVQIAHAVGAKVLVDAAQSIAHQKIDVKALDCDFLAFSGHKLYGPTGVGVLFIQSRLFDECVLQNFGGGMVYIVEEKDSEFKSMPHCLEPGTQAIAQVIGLGAAIDFVKKHIDFEAVQHHETKLACKFAAELEKIPGITILSHVPEQGEHNNMVTFVVDAIHAYDVATYLDQYGIAVRAGYHCVHLYHEKLGGNNSIRASFSIYNTEEEVDFLVACLKKMFVAN